MEALIPLFIDVEGGERVSALLNAPADANACCVLAHGAGAGMNHPFMVAVAAGLGERRIACLRYQFPYMERGSKRPDSPMLARATVRAAVAEAARQLPKLPLFAGGKSFGGRMTSQAQSARPLEGVRGLIFFGFPLHAPGKPSDERGKHLFDVKVPMLFLQGSRDELASLDLLQPLTGKLGATLRVFDDADHSFLLPARSGRKSAEVMAEALDVARGWVSGLGSSAPSARGPGPARG